MKTPMLLTTAVVATLVVGTGVAYAGRYQDATQSFKDANQSAAYFNSSYAYAVFPTIGEGGFGVGAAHGRGRVFRHGDRVGDTTVTQLSIGWQLGGEVYSEIIFFKDKQALEVFESGQFQFGAGASVVAITAAAAADANTQGLGAGASVGDDDAAVAGNYYKGMAVFTIYKGGLMFDASLEGEKFSFKAIGT